MNDYLDAMLRDRLIREPDGRTIPLESTIDRPRAELLQRTIAGNDVARVVEVGCAMGVSSVAIQDALVASGRSNRRHVIVDPYQTAHWSDRGIKNLRRAGFSDFEVIQRGSEYVLPDLAEKSETFDFGVIDGWHTLDHTLIDFFYINRMIRVGGFVAIDDIHMDGINRVVRYVASYPCYAQHDWTPPREITAGRRVLDGSRRALGAAVRFFNKRLGWELLSAECNRPNADLHLYSSMVVFRKTAADERPWNWYEPC